MLNIRKNGKLAITLMLALLLTLCSACESTKESTADNSAPPTISNQPEDQQTPAPQPTEGNPSIAPTEPSDEKSGHTQESGQVDTNDFDKNLAGSWRLISETHNGSGKISWGYSLYFLLDGTIYGDIFCDYPDYIESGHDPVKATTADGKLELFDAWAQYYLDTSVATQEEVDAIQLNIDYQLSDIQESSKDASDAPFYYQKYDNDQLTLHITGQNQISPTEIRTIDSTLVYEKRYPIFMDNYYEPCLYGEWTDNIGNNWTFSYEKNTNGYYDFVFQMIDTKGIAHTGNLISHGWSDKDPECVEKFNFYFDNFSTDYYRIVDFDGTSLVLKSDSGDLVLTKK